MQFETYHVLANRDQLEGAGLYSDAWKVHTHKSGLQQSMKLVALRDWI